MTFSWMPQQPTWTDAATEDVQKRFNELRGVHHPYGGEQPKPLAPGKRYNNGEFVITPGFAGSPDWTDYSPGDDYVKIGYTQQAYTNNARNDGSGNEKSGPEPMLIWQRKASPAPAPSAAPKKEDNTDYYARARQLAGQFQAGGGSGSYAGGFKPIQVGGGPEGYDQAAAQGTYNSVADMANNYLGKAEGYRSSNRFLPDLISAEIGGATREAIAKLPDNLKLPSVMTPDELLGYAKKSASSFGLN